MSFKLVCETKVYGVIWRLVLWCNTDQTGHCALFWPKRIGYDPKGCELCLCRMKPGESLVEVRSDANVQIAR